MEGLTALCAFAHAVELKSFAAAGRRLGISASAVSKSVARLEDRYGVRLLNRTTRSISLTAEGAAFYDRCVRILVELEEAELAIAQRCASPSGLLRVDMPVALGRLGIIPALPRFLERCPKVEIDASLNDCITNLVKEGIDVAVRIGGGADSRLVSRRLAPHRLCTCAAPSYLERCGIPRQPDDLLNHNCLNFRFPTTGRLKLWRFQSGGEKRELRAPGNLTFDNGEALIEAAVAGLGIIQVPSYMVTAAIEAGALRLLLREYAIENSSIAVVYPQNRHLSPKVRAFVDFLIELVSPEPPWDRAMTQVD